MVDPATRRCFATQPIESTATDSDVVAEAERLRSGDYDPAEEPIVIRGLAKRYLPRFGFCGATKVAVENMSVGIPRNACFGLLGVNGAGKTTTFRMLTGDEWPTQGTAIMNGLDIRTQMMQVRQHIGYCPQFDALIELMTGREILTMFARLRGVNDARVADEVQGLVDLLNLEKHADKLSWTYSGGNKRKLSTAIALVGSPPIVFLDEHVFCQTVDIAQAGVALDCVCFAARVPPSGCTCGESKRNRAVLC